jgi:hypothetical protein
MPWTQPYKCFNARIMNLAKRVSSNRFVSSRRRPRRGTWVKSQRRGTHTFSKKKANAISTRGLDKPVQL